VRRRDAPRFYPTRPGCGGAIGVGPGSHAPEVRPTVERHRRQQRDSGEAMFTRALWVGVMVTAVGAGAVAQYKSPRGQVIFPDKTKVIVEIADTPELTQRGLMFRRQMGENEGMVFLFEEPDIIPFWMKNTLIPLDIIWLDARRRIVHIAHSVPPCKADPCPSYPPSRPAQYVVEVNSGFAKRHGVKEGDVLEFHNIKPRGQNR
jgi:uncharacterized protein